MTVSLTARDEDGSFGIVIASSSPAVASRCAWLRAGVGASATQNVTNPSLGPAVLDALAAGADAAGAVALAIGDDEHAAFRQLTAVGVAGDAAVHSGSRSLGVNGDAVGNGCVAAGNLLANDGVLPAMRDAFLSADGTLETRLLTALRAALAAGGEAGELRSAGLLVVADAPWNVTDLRVDDHDSPVTELARLLELWLPQKDAYLTRALSPEAAPSYGVPGDE
ncbi:DUF1028 domain-containing protein [Mycetocola reblochoni]|uniref:Major pilin protein fimA n=2 Tax=Mycetocola reblochoni TaxID=331618 RepID=A0A1R4KAQ6_9MICO|nr:DUF1028 domain-containing protein [Mycetocola reblochoni]RLP71192.1 DUF1028 domain-containing protein [Mycetocola reblochoni]SJN41225.1 hypothetical protein FM119_12500 [Mycetocola reblochoni REB411]